MSTDRCGDLVLVTLEESGTGLCRIKDDQTEKLACGRRRTINMESVEVVDIEASTASFCIQCNAVMKT